MRTMFAFLVIAIADYLGQKDTNKMSEGAMKLMALVLFIGVAVSILADIKEFLQ